MNTHERADDRSLLSALAEIANLVKTGAFSTGDIAALRRMDPRSPPAAFFKVVGVVLDDRLPGDASARADEETRWAAILAGLACLGSLHDPSRRLGVALAEAEFSELRFSRLLRADADRLVDDIPALARFLAAKGVPADWGAAAQLMLSAGRAPEETVRRHIARDYYAILAREEAR